MSRYTASDLARLGPAARRQIELYRLAERVQAEHQAAQAARPNKYGAVRVQVDGRWFDSKAEARRYQELKALQRAGLISDQLILQPEYPIEVAGQRVAIWRGDFEYTDQEGRRIVEDVKGVETAVFKLKRRLVEALHGISITVVKA